jgi:seryl-tRNA synthetase
MHDIEYIRNNPQLFDQELQRRDLDIKSQEILALDTEIRHNKTNLQQLQQQKNQLAKEIGSLKSQGKDAKELFIQAEKIKSDIAKLSNDELATKLQKLLASLPNLLALDVPKGKSEADNVEIRKWGKINSKDFIEKEHYQLNQQLSLLDFTNAAKISGSRFAILKGDLARLERILASFMLDMLTQQYDFTEVAPPLLVKGDSLYGTGQLPKFAQESFTTTDNRWLIPTAEVPLVNLVSKEIIAKEALPLKFAAYTPCFRSEAGAAGKDTKGMIRLHQFNKVEMVVITTPEQSEKEHERITNIAELILQKLNLPYRVMLLAAGDTGFSAKKTYDIEVWLAGQKQYREISSCSNCGDFQARRIKARFKDNQNQIKFPHSLNGSALAVGRTLLAILENYQNADGSITVPEILVPAMGKSIIQM